MYNPLKEFQQRADNYGFDYEITQKQLIKQEGKKILKVSFKAPHNKDGYCLIGLMAHWRMSGRCMQYGYLAIEPRRPTMYFEVDEQTNNPIRTTKPNHDGN